MADKDLTRLELSKITGKKPHWLIRWGVTVLFLIVIFGSLIWYMGLSNLLP